MFVSVVPSPQAHTDNIGLHATMGNWWKRPETFICMDYFNCYCLKAVFIVIYLKKKDEKIK